jgi:hypothetical protein
VQLHIKLVLKGKKDMFKIYPVPSNTFVIANAAYRKAEPVRVSVSVPLPGSKLRAASRKALRAYKKGAASRREGKEKGSGIKQSQGFLTSCT